MKLSEYRKQRHQRELYKGIRKPMPKPSRAITPKNAYDRKDTSWRDDS